MIDKSYIWRIFGHIKNMLENILGFLKIGFW